MLTKYNKMVNDKRQAENFRKGNKEDGTKNKTEDEAQNGNKGNGIVCVVYRADYGGSVY